MKREIDAAARTPGDGVNVERLEPHPRDVAHYDPDKGLKTIAVAEAGERHWARAKDATRLFAAIEAKITAQAEYVIWRDGVIVHGNGPGRGHHASKKEISDQKLLLPAADPGDVTAHRWRKKLCGKGPLGATIIDPINFGLALDDAQRRALRICEQQKAGTIRGAEGTGEFERYTPAKYVEAAREVMGEIDLDPATSEKAQETVRAKAYFTLEADGLAREWRGRVWLNPPYHRDLQILFIAKLIEEIEAGRVTQAIMLTNNSTDTDWFGIAFNGSACLCFTHGRIHFATPEGLEVLPTQGQTFFYYGGEPSRFADVFTRPFDDEEKGIGWCCEKYVGEISG